ncbi:hypothetical protein LINPERPRIM_LOCUS7333 [Linum perenne]
MRKQMVVLYENWLFDEEVSFILGIAVAFQPPQPLVAHRIMAAVYSQQCEAPNLYSQRIPIHHTTTIRNNQISTDVIELVPEASRHGKSIAHSPHDPNEEYVSETGVHNVVRL